VAKKSLEARCERLEVLAKGRHNRLDRLRRDLRDIKLNVAGFKPLANVIAPPRDVGVGFEVEGTAGNDHRRVRI
jgi:hypothetical protein